MSDCTACAAFERDRNSGAYRTACTECTARGLARSLRYFLVAKAAAEAKAAGKPFALPQDYRDALQAAFGADWQAGHARAKACAQRIAAC